MHVVATAGHIDHGKSTLIRALTGMEPDRLDEEQRRGMTTDLGFAWTQLPSGEAVAFVDVPGHERFVSTMLAGVGPVPAVLFVVAADEGWRRQSAEHLAALEALGVRHGVLAISRSDLSAPGPAAAAAAAELAATSLGAVETVAVSGVTGFGLDDLRAALDRLVARLPAPDDRSPVRLWVDRAFTIRGAGTVVTGTLGEGTLRVGDELDLDGRTVRVRALESLKEQASAIRAVARVAVNLRGLERDKVRRGQALVTPGAWWRTDCVDVRLTAPIDIDVPAELVLHLGSAAVAVHVRAFDSRTARLRLAHQLPLHVGDRALLRDPGWHRIVCGLEVLDVDPAPLRRRGAAHIRAADLAPLGGPPNWREEVRRRGIVRRDVLHAMGFEAPEETVGGWLVSPQRRDDLRKELSAIVREYDSTHPLEPGVPRSAAQHQLDLPDPELVDWIATGLATIEGGRLRAGGARPELPAGVRVVRQRLATKPYVAPEASELSQLGLTEQVLAAAVRTGALARIVPGIYLLPGAVELAAEALAGLRQPFTTSEARRALGTTRRVAVPLLEQLDARGLTERLDAAHRRVTRPPHP